MATRTQYHADTGRMFLAQAWALHVNFYDGVLSREAIEDYLSEVERLVETLGRLTG